MAKCKECGRWAGIGRNQHDYNCVAVPPPPRTEMDLLVDKLTPALMKAARTAGIAAAFTLVAISAVLWVVFAIGSALLR